jgi:uncharacterized protein
VHLTIIAKETRPGFVKTRLCPPCSPETAAELATAALLDTLDAVDTVVREATDRGLTLEPTLLFDGDPSALIRPGYAVVAQRGDGLDERLAHGFEDLGPGFIVGMETPQAVHSIGRAIDFVEFGHDAIGLATDGGYWVIGLGRVDSDVFRAIPMSQSHTGLAQLRRLHALGRQVRMLPMVRDLDTFADVEAAAHAREDTRLTRVARRVVAEVRSDT